jgi:hypothetical protein
MSDKRLFWISKCPECHGNKYQTGCQECDEFGETREEVKVPADDGDRLTPAWITQVLPGTDPVGNTDNPCWGRHEGRLGRVVYQFYPRSGGLALWVNGFNYDWRNATRGDLRKLCAALGVELKEG